MTHFVAPPSSASSEDEGGSAATATGGVVDDQPDTNTSSIVNIGPSPPPPAAKANTSNNKLPDGKTAEELTINDAIRQKEEGNKHIAKQRYHEAEICYSTGIDVVMVLRERMTAANKDHGDANVDIELLRKTEVNLRSNLALVLNRQQRYDESERHCAVALEADPNNAKVLFRRARARELLTPAADLDGAVKDLSKSLDILKSQKEGERDKTWGGMVRDTQKALNRIRERIASEKEDTGKQQQRTAIVSPDASQQQQQEEEEVILAEPMTIANGDGPSDESFSSEGPPPCSTPSPMEQRKIILRLLAGVEVNSSKGSIGGRNRDFEPHRPVAGEAYYLIDARWWRSWCRQVDFFRDAELEEAQRAVKEAPNAASKKKATMAKASAFKARLGALSLLPPGASLLAPIARKIQDGKAKRRSSTASSSSSSSEESEDDEWLDIPGAFGPLPGTIDNSLLILNTDGKAGTKDAHDEFFTEWCRPSDYGEDGGPAAVVAASASNNDVYQQDDQSPFVRLRPNLVRGHHFECLPREAYGALACWYGEETPPIRRRATAPTKNNDSGKAMARLMLYPELQHNETGTLSPTWSGKASSVVRCGACKTPGATSRCTRCLSVCYCRKDCQISHWSYHKTICKAVASTSRKEVGETIEVKKEVHETTTTTTTIGTKPIEEDSSEWGRIGLYNLGNTCFMNSAIQCLSHSAPLTKYFLSGRFRIDLNPDNPLGAGGKLALAYEEVIKALWMNGARKTGCISPTAMKRAIALHAPQFAGVNQHDSHEFITYLLDALHEDLNRVRDAPYVEMPDALPGQKLTIAGAEAWDLHRRRNDSLVMDTFFGQFKSTCVCPRCQKISVSYDAFKDVSLEIPQFRITQRVINIILFRATAKGGPVVPLTRYGLVVQKSATIEDLRLALAETCGVPATKLALCEAWKHNFQAIYHDNQAVSKIGHADVLYAYEIHPYESAMVHAPVTHIVSNNTESCQFGVPFLTSFPADLTCRQVWEHVWTQLRRFINSDEPDADDRKGLLRIRVVDSDGSPIALFKADGEPGPEGTGVATSVLPMTSDARIGDILGNDGIDNYVFLSCEWTDCGEAYLNFDKCVDHPSFLSAHQKQQELNSRYVTLNRCFETFTTPERLDGNNLYYCSSCKDHVRATKTMELWRLPNVLVVHLKRFEFRNALRSNKDETFVDFPLEGLDMSRYCAHPNATVPSSAFASNGNGGGSNADNSDFVVDSIPAMYDLFGVVNHYGRLGFGHYTAYARRWDENGMDKEWALFDDSSVRDVGDGKTGRVGDGMIVTPAAYVLFYRRRVFT